MCCDWCDFSLEIFSRLEDQVMLRSVKRRIV